MPIDTVWIEVSYWAKGSTQQFYWADCRAGASYYEGAFGTVTASDKYQPNYYYQIRDGDGKTQNSPLVSGWTTGAPAPGGTGGDWYAYCGGGGFC